MNLDGIILQRLGQELNETLRTGQITKIYQLDSCTLYFRVHTGCEQHHLIFTLNRTPLVYLAKESPVTPDTPTGLAMFLRKYLENGRIGAIYALDHDRILVFDIDVMGPNGQLITRRFYGELMGKHSNFILTEENVILDALVRHQKETATSRFIGPKTPYELPPNHHRMNPLDFTAQELYDLLESQYEEGDSLTGLLPRLFLNLPMYMMEEIAYRANETPTEAVRPSSFALISQALYDVSQEIKGSTQVFVYRSKGRTILSPIVLSHKTEKPHVLSSLLAFLQEEMEKAEGFSPEQTNLLHLVQQQIKKQERKVKNIQKDQKETEQLDLCRLYGDLLMAYAYMDSHYKSALTVANLFSPEQEEISIPLTPGHTITENANRYYRKYTKLKNRIHQSQLILDEIKRLITYLQSVEYSLTLPLKKEELKAIRQELGDIKILSKKKESPKVAKVGPTYYTCEKEGFTIWIGKNNQQNDWLSLKKAHPYDLWFHAKNIPGSHVILRCHDQEAPEEVILYAAQLAAYYSKGKESPKVEVDSLYCRQLKKPVGSPPGFVVYENQKTYFVAPCPIES